MSLVFLCVITKKNVDDDDLASEIAEACAKAGVLKTGDVVQTADGNKYTIAPKYFTLEKTAKGDPSATKPRPRGKKNVRVQ